MFRLAIFSACLALAVAQNSSQVQTGQLGDAIQNFNNPPGAAYRAVVAPNALNVTGMITAVTSDDGATEFAIQFENLPKEGGPFLYHIHVNPVAPDGNCNSTLAHLDPFLRGEATPCVAKFPQTCQVGDLSGKHGTIENATSFNASYVDTFVSLKEGVGAFFGNRSFVVHFANTTRIGCGNFTTLSEAEQPNLLNASVTVTSQPAAEATLGSSSTISEFPISATTRARNSATTESAPRQSTSNFAAKVTTSLATRTETSFATALLLFFVFMSLL